MKKKGFTLAEILITLAMIGVVAALTIPTFVTNSQNKANAAKLSTTISTLENAFTTMITSEAVNDFSETVFGRNYSKKVQDDDNKSGASSTATTDGDSSSGNNTDSTPTTGDNSSSGNNTDFTPTTGGNSNSENKTDSTPTTGGNDNSGNNSSTKPNVGGSNTPGSNKTPQLNLRSYNFNSLFFPAAFATQNQNTHETTSTEYIEQLRNAIVGLNKVLKTTGTKSTIKDYYGSDSPFKIIKGDSYTPSDVVGVIQMKNGALLIYSSNVVSRENAESLGGSVTDSIAKLTIDVNGTENPNIVGRDVFVFRLGNDGNLYPAGGLNYSILESNSATNLWASSPTTDYGCGTDVPNGVDEKGNPIKVNAMGLGCTARLVEKNFEIDY